MLHLAEASEKGQDPRTTVEPMMMMMMIWHVEVLTNDSNKVK
jgi:hypothetical protein